MFVHCTLQRLQEEVGLAQLHENGTALVANPESCSLNSTDKLIKQAMAAENMGWHLHKGLDSTDDASSRQHYVPVQFVEENVLQKC